MVSFNALRTRRNAIFAALGALLLTIFVVVAIYIIRLQLKPKGGEEESDHTPEELNQKESVKPLVGQITDHLKAYKEGKITEVDRDLILGLYNEAKNKLDAAEDKADHEKFLAQNVDEIIRQCKESKPIPGGPGRETGSTSGEGESEERNQKESVKPLVDQITDHLKAYKEGKITEVDRGLILGLYNEAKNKLDAAEDKADHEKFLAHSVDEIIRQCKESKPPIRGGPGRETGSTSGEGESEGRRKKVETEPNYSPMIDILNVALPSPKPIISSEKFHNFFSTFYEIRENFKKFILSGEDPKIKSGIEDIKSKLNSLDPNIPDDQIPIQLKRDSSIQTIKQSLIRYLFVDIAEYFIERIETMITEDASSNKLELVVTRWHSLIEDAVPEEVLIEKYSPYLTAMSAQKLHEIYDNVKSLDDISLEFVQKVDFLFDNPDKFIALKYKEEPTVENLEKLLDTLLSGRYQRKYFYLSLESFVEKFISCYFQRNPFRIATLLARIDYVSRMNFSDSSEGFTKEGMDLINLIIKDPSQVADKQEFAGTGSFLYSYGNFLLASMNEEERCFLSEISDPSKLTNLRKSAEHVNYLYKKSILLRVPLIRGIQLTFGNADKLLAAFAKLHPPGFFDYSFKLVNYFISKFKILGDENPEKKEIANGLQEFSLNALTRLMKTDHNLSGFCNSLEECVAAPTADNLSNLYALREKLHAEASREEEPFEEDFFIICFTNTLMKFVEASKAIGCWKSNPSIIDFLEKFSLQLYKESSLKFYCLLHCPDILPKLEEQLVNPSFVDMRKLMEEIKDPLIVSKKFFDIYLLATEAKIALDKLDPSKPSTTLVNFSLLNELFAPARLFYAANKISSKTRFFDRGKVIPENELKLIFKLLRTSFVEFQLEKCSLIGFLRNLEDINFLDNIKGVDLENFRLKLWFIIDELVPGFRRLTDHLKSLHLLA